MDLFVVIALLVVLSAFYSYINARFIKLPGTIGIVTLAISVSVITILVDSLYPSVAKYLTELAVGINFSRTVLNIMLGFLLFSSSFSLNTRRLKKEMRPVFILSTVGVILSTAVFGGLFYGITLLIGVKIPLVYCFLFGALISPTDPVSVHAIIKSSRLPTSLETIISGESLFNDGIGLVLFITILEFIESGTANIDFAQAGLLFIREVFGGIILGIVFGFIGFRLMKTITDFQTIVLISVALVMSISVVATFLHLSIPLAVVSAGLFAGNQTINIDNNERSHQSLEKFWQLIDEMLNTILFVMIGLQMINLPYLNNYWLIGLMGIIIALAARWISILIPLTFFRKIVDIKYRNINILTWAGLRGGISIALALSLPYSPYRHIILAGAYFIVIFSVIVQGLTLNKVINASLPPEEEDSK
ncbi:cation:proton antiporter [Mucilaginibacter antarcticus]|uniref:Cation:proton antiporter n=1 Tax=Mucilaginibacter antarcticus TaxID=1855725 RepID=A0ABW5XUI9_9SPHI